MPVYVVAFFTLAMQFTKALSKPAATDIRSVTYRLTRAEYAFL
jgi:hypothetical protein